MSKWVIPFRRNLMMRFMGMMLTVLVLFFIGAGALYLNEQREQEEFRKMDEVLVAKQEILDELSHHFTGVFFRARGYFMLQNEEEYKKMFEEKAAVERNIADYKKYQASAREIQVMDNLDSLLKDFFTRALPMATELSQNGDYRELRNLSQQGATMQMNHLLEELSSLNAEYRTRGQEKQTKVIDRLQAQNVQYIVYVLFIMFLLFLMMIKTARDLGMPMIRLAGSAKAFTLGGVDKVNYTDRPDEIGVLARSLQSMMIQIQAKEEELVAQNEELQAQQDELQMQQEELTEALVKMEEKEHSLQKHNQFIRSISTTLDRQELLQSIITHMAAIMKADKGVLLLPGAQTDYASFGLSEHSIIQFVTNYREGILPRLEETKVPYSIHRQASDAEKGYHLGQLSASDIFVPVLHSNGEIIAILALTRFSREFTFKEEEETKSFAQQISLSLEKLAIYEDAESHRKLTQDILDTIDVGVQLLDRHGTTIQVNSSWKRMMMLEHDDNPEVHLTLEDMETKLSPLLADATPLRQYLTDLMDGRSAEQQRIIYEMAMPDRSMIEMYSKPLFTGSNHAGTLLVHRDITKEYEADEMKSEFVSTVSHELRTPLASVLGFAELLLHKELTAERQKKYIRTIHQEAHRLTSLINDFLDLQRMESGRQTYHFSRVSLAELIEETIDMQRVQATKHTFVFDNAAGDVTVKADSDKIKQVLMNVVGNAVKYSPSGGKVGITLGIEDSYLRVDISDEGLGIPAEAIPQLFQKFYRVDNTDRRQIGGTGLGLAIVKEIMQHHGGDVQVTSTYGQGSTFSLLLPFVNEGYRESELQTGQASRTIFIVEDDASLSNLLAEELTGSGYQAVQFTSGEKAFEAMLEQPPTAVVLDLVLTHGMSGWTVIEKMKQTDALKHVPILISSAFEEKERALDIGARGYLVKPYLPHKLSMALLQIINDHQHARGSIFVPGPIPNNE